MPQTFQVLRCYKCEVFQVHPTKKANKWKCKLCNEKQSIKRFYGLGSGKECRIHVQKLNGIRGNINAIQCESDDSHSSSGTQDPEESGRNQIIPQSVAKKSKWEDYIDSDENQFTADNQQVSDEPMFLKNTEIVLELPKKCPRKSFTMSKKNMNNPKPKELLKLHSQPSTKKYESANILKNTDEKQNIAHSSKINVVNDGSETQIGYNTKWAKFLNDLQNYNNENSLDPNSHTDSATSAWYPMFRFQDEEDLDSVLDL